MGHLLRLCAQQQNGHLTAHLTRVDVGIKAPSKSAVKLSILNSRGPSGVPEPPALNLSRRKEGNVSRRVARPFVSEFRRRKEEAYLMWAVHFIGMVMGWELANRLLREVWVLHLTTGNIWRATSILYYTLSLTGNKCTPGNSRGASVWLVSCDCSHKSGSCVILMGHLLVTLELHCCTESSVNLDWPSVTWLQGRMGNHKTAALTSITPGLAVEINVPCINHTPHYHWENNWA